MDLNRPKQPMLTLQTQPESSVFQLLYAKRAKLAKQPGNTRFKAENTTPH